MGVDIGKYGLGVKINGDNLDGALLDLAIRYGPQSHNFYCLKFFFFEFSFAIQ